MKEHTRPTVFAPCGKEGRQWQVSSEQAVFFSTKIMNTYQFSDAFSSDWLLCVSDSLDSLPSDVRINISDYWNYISCMVDRTIQSLSLGAKSITDSQSNAQRGFFCEQYLGD